MENDFISILADSLGMSIIASFVCGDLIFVLSKLKYVHFFFSEAFSY